MRGRIFAIILAVTVLFSSPYGVADEPRSYQPPANTPVIPWKRFSINYAVRVVGNALTSKVEFYISDNGGMTWKKYGEDPDMVSPMVISVPSEGTYGLITAVSTNVRPALAPRPGTKPDRFIIVDRTPPEAKWLSPDSEQILLTESGIELSWTSSDKHLGLTPVDIEYSTDGGNFWLPLREKLPAKGSITWNPPVMEGRTDIALRLIATDLAGNKRIVRNKASFTLDNTPPVITILGPSSSSDFKFDIDYTVTDDESGVKSVELFYTVDGGTEWFYFGPDSDLSSPLSFSAPAAKEVGLYIVATDNNGNKNPAPARGAMPMAYVTLDMQPPQVTILPPFTTSGEVFAMGQIADIRWNSTDENIKENSTLIQMSRDGGATWTDLAYDKPANGSWQWVPEVPGNNLLLKISVADVMGNIGTAISMPFAVDEKRPSMQFDSITPIDNSGSSMIQQPDTQYSEPADDLWAPSVPSTVELESESITDLPAQTPVESSLDIEESTVATDDFAPVDESMQDDGFADIPPADISSTELEIPAPADNSAVPSLNDDFANNEITEDDFAPLETTDDTDMGFEPIAEESIESISEEIPAPDDDMSLESLGDLGLDSIPEVPAITEETVEETADTFDDSLLSGDDFATIPEPESLSTDDSIDTEDMTIPDIPEVTGSTEETIEDISSIPDVPAISESEDSTETVDDFGFAPIEEISEDTVEEIDLPLDLGMEEPAEPTVSVDELISEAQTAFEQDEDYDKAESLAKEVIKLDPDNAQAYAIIASVLTEKGNYDSAFDYAHKAINLAPERAEYLQILGYAQYQKALEINKMLGSSDLTPSQASSLGTQLMTALDQAQEAYSKMLSSTNEIDVKEGYYRLAQVDYFKATRVITDDVQMTETLRRAIANYQKAYSIGEPDYREVLQIGISNYRIGDYDQAEQWLEKAQEIATVDRNPKEAFFYLALINEKTNRPEGALPFWQKVAEYYPEGSSYRKLAETRIQALSGL